jgi:hypothetical protein
MGVAEPLLLERALVQAQAQAQGLEQVPVMVAPETVSLLHERST